MGYGLISIFCLLPTELIEVNLGMGQEKYKRKPQLGEPPSIRSKCAWLSCGVLIISSLGWELMIFYLPYPKTTIVKLEQLTVVKLFNKPERRKTPFYR